MMRNVDIIGDQKIVTTFMDNKVVTIEKYKLVNGDYVLISVDLKKEESTND